MAKTHIFTGNVHHDGTAYAKGQECPEKFIDIMVKKNLAAPLPEPIKPTPASKPDAKKE